MKSVLKEELIEAFENFKNALFENDKDTLEKLLAIDFQGFNIYGYPENREIILDVYGSGDVKLDKYEVDDLSFRVIGEIGIITGKGLITGNYKTDTFRHHIRFCDLYIHRDSYWQLYLSQATEIKS
ncbi:MAG: hypothetical protein AMJ61_02230 [Desulfobacterales bacterium SG8_35_2]|nr:MAG: hypothetical protein AMJ61_02230 [Desulfobacterales bacterium SG8_35_2]